MRTSDISEYAWQLMQSFGDKAAVEAGKRERQALDDGNQDEAEQWSRIRKAIEERKGAHAS